MPRRTSPHSLYPGQCRYGPPFSTLWPLAGTSNSHANTGFGCSGFRIGHTRAVEADANHAIDDSSELKLFQCRSVSQIPQWQVTYLLYILMMQIYFTLVISRNSQ